ncbi:ABC transporter substrate-binding protein [Haloplasma contractile]|uniref:ABC transporter substrate-binding lipoprotein n=1 Tax=Haloplasma contractile SSD-17B TaxID=1033810 RepID=U2E7C3_9MOLU|nr:MqnA/MqnD/SBP family protein [Haloplasma contractile]ERJ11103.1 Putative ABC transporter substrate-binding lipoprotein [Haloplasma contractile SSD-17B]
MRKYLILSIIFTLSIVLFGCNEDEKTSDGQNTVDEVKIIVPKGGPTVTLIEMIHEDNLTIEGVNITIETVDGPNLLVSAITSQSHDIVIAPTNLGAKLYNKNSSYRFAGTVAWGNLYLVSRDENVNIADLENKTIVAFGEKSTPDILLQLALKQHGLTVGENVTIEYYNSLTDIAPMFKKGDYDYALLAEPVLTKLGYNDEKYITLDLQTEWKSITNNDSYPQAGIFINETLINEQETLVNAIINEIKSSIEFATNNPDSAGTYYEQADLGLKAGIIKQSIPRLNIRFSSASDSKLALESYLNEIIDFDSKLIGDTLPSDDFYYQYD